MHLRVVVCCVTRTVRKPLRQPHRDTTARVRRLLAGLSSVPKADYFQTHLLPIAYPHGFFRGADLPLPWLSKPASTNKPKKEYSHATDNFFPNEYH